MSGNSHLFKNRQQLGTSRRKATTTSTPEQVVARMTLALERYVKQHSAMTFDRGENWVMIEISPSTPLLLIELQAVYGDETASSILVRTRLTHESLHCDGTYRSSSRSSSERSALQHIFNTIHAILRAAPAAIEGS